MHGGRFGLVIEDLAEPPQWKVPTRFTGDAAGYCPDPADLARSADRGELCRPPGADGDGCPKPRRGSGFLRPQLDTAPFPNYFVVEPPVYQLAVVALRRIAGWKLEACGRFVSAVAMGLGAWGLFGLIRRREGERSPSRP